MKHLLLFLVVLGFLGSKSDEEIRVFSEAAEREEKKTEKDHAALQTQAQQLLRDLLDDNGALRETRLCAVVAASREVKLIIVNLRPLEAKLTDWDWTTLFCYLLKNDPSENIKSLAASSLGYAGIFEQAKPALLEALEDPAVNVRLFACQSLMWSKDKTLAKPVVKLLADKNKWVRQTAVRTLGWLGDNSCVEAIVKLHRQDGGNSDDDWYFADALARLGEKEVSLKCVQNCMKSNNWNVRHFAGQSLAFIDSPQVVGVILSELVPELKRTVAVAQNGRVEDQLFVRLCQELQKRTGQSFGHDVLRWHAWWAKAHKEYKGRAVEIDREAVQTLLEEYRKMQPSRID